MQPLQSLVTTCLLATALIPSAAHAATLALAPFGTSSDGHPVTRATMTAADGVSVSFISLGGAVVDVVAPDRCGTPGHVVLGFPRLRDYETVDADDELYFGALLGRTANWLARGRFVLHGRTYQVPLSDPPNTIHGGTKGFDRRFWSITPQTTAGSSVSARLDYTSPDGEQGYPGALKVTVTYKLSDDGSFAIHYAATSDRDTVLNLSNHMNFALAGAGSPDGVLATRLTVRAHRYVPVDNAQIPLNRFDPVDGTPFDFRTPVAIGARIRDRNPQLQIAHGYDTYFLLDGRGGGDHPRLAVHAEDPGSGRTLDCFTTEPGVQIYTGGYFDGSVVGIGGHYGRYAGFTLETQHPADSPNQPAFPSIELQAGRLFESETIFRFGVQR